MRSRRDVKVESEQRVISTGLYAIVRIRCMHARPAVS